MSERREYSAFQETRNALIKEIKDLTSIINAKYEEPIDFTDGYYTNLNEIEDHLSALSEHIMQLEAGGGSTEDVNKLKQLYFSIEHSSNEVKDMMNIDNDKRELLAKRMEVELLSEIERRLNLILKKMRVLYPVDDYAGPPIIFG